MTSLTLLLWRHSPLYYIVYYDVTNTFTMTSLTPFTMTSLTPFTMTSLTLLLHFYYDVTNTSTMTSLTPFTMTFLPLLPMLLWRPYPFYPCYYDVPTPFTHATMTSLPYHLRRQRRQCLSEQTQYFRRAKSQTIRETCCPPDPVRAVTS